VTGAQKAAIGVDLDALTQPHRRFPGSVEWALTPSGVSIAGARPAGSDGSPVTVERIWHDFEALILSAAGRYGVPAELIVAVIATESAGHADALREEPGYVSDEVTPGRVSAGLMQTLISTAREALRDTTIDRGFLVRPAGSIEAGTAYIAAQFKKTGFDPPPVACAYNAGSVIHDPSAGNRWKMRQYPLGTGRHADRFMGFFNDCFLVLDDVESNTPSFRRLFNKECELTA